MNQTSEARNSQLNSVSELKNQNLTKNNQTKKTLPQTNPDKPNKKKMTSEELVWGKLGLYDKFQHTCRIKRIFD